MAENVTEDISQLRQKLKLLACQNQTLKQQLRAKEDTCKNHAQKVKSFREDQRRAQKLLHTYAGADVTLAGGVLEVSMRSFYSGIPCRQYNFFFQNRENTTWQVTGYNMPLSVHRAKGMTLQTEELAKFIRDVSREVNAYNARKYQVTEVEKILDTKKASIWFSIKLQTVVLTVPVVTPTSKYVAEVTLQYEVDHILPFKVTTNAPGLNDAERLETLRTRLTNVFLHYPLVMVFEEEFKGDTGEVSILSISNGPTP